MRLATWNVNSLMARLPRLVEWLDIARPDVLCLQETKLADAAFPREQLIELGYAVATYGLNHFQAKDFRRLRSEYPAVTWTVVHGPAPSGMTCPYQERGYSVCQIPLG